MAPKQDFSHQSYLRNAVKYMYSTKAIYAKLATYPTYNQYSFTILVV